MRMNLLVLDWMCRKEEVEEEGVGKNNNKEKECANLGRKFTFPFFGVFRGASRREEEEVP